MSKAHTVQIKLQQWLAALQNFLDVIQVRETQASLRQVLKRKILIQGDALQSELVACLIEQSFFTQSAAYFLAQRLPKLL